MARRSFQILETVVSLVTAAAASPQAARSMPDPRFRPGLYETETRNTAFQSENDRGEQCISAPDYESFRRETMARYAALPQFKAICRLSDTRDTADGFAFAMNCTGAETIVAFHFAKDLVASTTWTLFVARPEYSSTILALSRRIGDCPARKPQDKTP